MVLFMCFLLDLLHLCVEYTLYIFYFLYIFYTCVTVKKEIAVRFRMSFFWQAKDIFISPLLAQSTMHFDRSST